jgi:hypothetical protein
MESKNGASSGVDDSLLQDMFVHAAELAAADEHPRVQDTTPSLPFSESVRSSAEAQFGETPRRAEVLPEPEGGLDVQAEHTVGGQEQAEDDAEEPVEKRETFPSQLEAMLNSMLATHQEMHPPFVADEDEADEGSAAPASRQPEVDDELQRDTPNSTEAQESGSAGLEEEQHECEPRQDGGSREDGSSADAAAQEAAAVKIQALARGGRDRRRAGQMRGDNAHERGMEGEESSAGVQDANERPGSRARSQSSEDEGARSSDEEGEHFSDEGDDNEAPAVPRKEDATASDAGTGIYPQQGEDAAVTKIQALARGKRDRQRVRELRDERGVRWEEPQDAQDLNASGEATISVSVAPALAPFCKMGQGTEDFDEDSVGATAAPGDAEDAEEEEEEERPRLSFAKPIELKKWSSADGQPGGGVEGEQEDPEEDEPAPRLTFAAPIHVAAPVPHNEIEEEDPPPKLSFAAPVQKVKAVAESKEAPAVSSSEDGGEDEYLGEEKATFGDKPVQSLDVWMADCADETMDGEEADAEAEGEEEQDGEEQSDVPDDLTGVEVGAEDRAPLPPQEKQVAPAARVAHASGAAAHRDIAPALPSPAAASVYSAVAGDRITQGLQTKLKAVEDKVQELQQQLLDQLSGGGGLEEGEDGQEEAVAALNERVEKLIRMRAQIMLALEHQKTLTAARPPSSTRMGTASPRVQDARILLPHAAATLPIRHQNENREDTSSMDWPNAHRRGRGGSNSPCEPTDSRRVPPPMKLPKDLSLKPIRGTSKVPPAMFQRNKPPPPASKLFEKYLEEPRGESRELAGPASIGVIHKPPKNSQHAAYIGGPRSDGTKAGAGLLRAIDYDSFNAQRREEDVKVSFKVLSDQRGSNVANRSHGRAAAIAAQERELQFAKEQDVLKNLVRNQVNLENRYTKEVERAAKLQRINHGDKPAGFSSRHASLFPAGASTKGPL